jgi:hypothetical protein
MTVHARRRIQQTIHKLLINSPERKVFNTVTKKWMKFTINFITLTIPNDVRLVDCKFGNKYLLEPWLRVMRNKYNLSDYIWKAEIQANGQLHYHITSNTFIHLTAIKDTWNNIMRKQGLLDGYYSKNSHYSPNSTDVHKVYKIKDVAAYLSKYISKDEQNTTSLNSKIWGCNKELSAIKLPNVEVNNTIGKELISMLESGECYEFTNEFVTLIKSNNKQNEISLPKSLKKARQEFREEFRNIHQEDEYLLFKTKKSKNVRPMVNRVVQDNYNLSTCDNICTNKADSKKQIVIQKELFNDC